MDVVIIKLLTLKTIACCCLASIGNTYVVSRTQCFHNVSCSVIFSRSVFYRCPLEQAINYSWIRQCFSARLAATGNFYEMKKTAIIVKNCDDATQDNRHFYSLINKAITRFRCPSLRPASCVGERPPGSPRYQTRPAFISKKIGEPCRWILSVEYRLLCISLWLIL